MSALSVPSTSRAALVTECSPPGAEGILAVCPWHRRSTSTNCQLGNACARRLANESKLRRDPRIPWMSTAVGGCGPSGCSALHRTSAPCTISYRSGAIAGSRAFAKLPLGPFVSVDNARATVSKRDRDRAPPASDGHSDEIGFADRDSRSARLERPVTAPRAPPGCDRPEDARHPEQTRARVAGAGERPEVVAAAARIASRMCDDKTYVWSNFRFFWTGELETDISSAIASKLGAPLHHDS